MIELKSNTGFTANTQNEEKVKSFCKYFFERNNAQICEFVNTLSKKISNTPYAQINGNYYRPPKMSTESERNLSGRYWFCREETLQFVSGAICSRENQSDKPKPRERRM